MEKNKAALYLRLSKEDKDKLTKGDESASIQNQRLLLADYALRHDYQIAEIYADDDESGLYDTRPEFERMLTDARLGKFQIVIAKSQSRFSRNMEHIEKYLHHDFPNLGIRFIGVVDGADTAVLGNKKSRQINGLVNEWYCEDLSENIRSALRAKMRDGQYLGASCPYGYVKDPKNHNRLIIDEYAAEVVRRIYDLYLKGYGKAKIGKILTEEGVLIPTRYKREVLGINYHNSHERKTTKNWSYQTIHTILNNEVYIGNMVQNKYHNLSYKDRRHVKQPKEQWIRVTGIHEAVIDPDTFAKVRERQKIRTRAVAAKGSASLFSGMIFCADCKHAMVRMYERRGDHRFIGYCCKTYKTQGKKMCARHAVNDVRLKKTVFAALQEEAGKILTSKDISNLKKAKYTDAAADSRQSRMRCIEEEIERKERYKKKTYQNYMDELISKEEYVSYIKAYEEEIRNHKNVLKQLEARQAEREERYDEQNKWVERFIHYIDMDELTREVVWELLEKIEVNEDGSVRLFYKFRGPGSSE